MINQKAPTFDVEALSDKLTGLLTPKGRKFSSKRAKKSGIFRYPLNKAFQTNFYRYF